MRARFGDLTGSDVANHCVLHSPTVLTDTAGFQPTTVVLIIAAFIRGSLLVRLPLLSYVKLVFPLGKPVQGAPSIESGLF